MACCPVPPRASAQGGPSRQLRGWIASGPRGATSFIFGSRFPRHALAGRTFPYAQHVQDCTRRPPPDITIEDHTEEVDHAAEKRNNPDGESNHARLEIIYVIPRRHGVCLFLVVGRESRERLVGEPSSLYQILLPLLNRPTRPRLIKAEACTDDN